MNSRILAIVAITFCIIEIESAPVGLQSRQFLPPVPGYVPVYIRTGDTPLEDINLDLAEAFRSYALKHGRSSIYQRGHNVLVPETTKDSNFQGGIIHVKIISAITEKPCEKKSQHIQKISRA